MERRIKKCIGSGDEKATSASEVSSMSEKIQMSEPQASTETSRDHLCNGVFNTLPRLLDARDDEYQLGHVDSGLRVLDGLAQRAC